MNFSAFLIAAARRAVQRVLSGHQIIHTAHGSHSYYAIFEAIVFAAMALEALLNELAFTEIHDLKRGSERVYRAVERGAQGFERFQAILEYLYGQALAEGEHHANDFKHLLNLRNGLVHYRFERPPVTTLTDLTQRGLFSEGWTDPIAWPTYALPGLAPWALQTASDTAYAIASLIADDPYHHAELVRTNFTPVLPDDSGEATGDESDA